MICPSTIYCILLLQLHLLLLYPLTIVLNYLQLPTSPQTFYIFLDSAFKQAAFSSWDDFCSFLHEENSYSNLKIQFIYHHLYETFSKPPPRPLVTLTPFCWTLGYSIYCPIKLFDVSNDKIFTLTSGFLPL